MNFQSIMFKREGAVAILTLNRPQALNAMTLAMHAEIFKALKLVREDDGIRALIITGAGRGFCSGDDMKESDPRDGAAPPEKEIEIVWHTIVREMRALPKPIIAAVNGIACGAGSGLVLGSDIRIASTRARFADIFIRRGIAGGAYLLTHVVGTAKALELTMTGDIIEAHEACQLGIFNRVVDHDALLPTALALAQRLASGPARSLALTKAAVYKVETLGLDEGLRVEEAAKLDSLKSADVREGIMAFVDKRGAAFKGR
ncbi:MAG: enoyl-CoA hydratase-related protein [Alphaproteobacteria bacterium]